MTGNIVSFDIGSAQIKLVWCAGGVCKAAVRRPIRLLMEHPPFHGSH